MVPARVVNFADFGGDQSCRKRGALLRNFRGRGIEREIVERACQDGRAGPFAQALQELPASAIASVPFVECGTTRCEFGRSRLTHDLSFSGGLSGRERGETGGWLVVLVARQGEFLPT